MTMPHNLPACDGPRRIAADAITAEADAIEALARGLHAHPEVGFEEFDSAAAITSFLAERGFAVNNDSRLPTAFVAEKGSGDLVVAINVEYDALPGVGHACGHNLIAGSSVAAGVGLAAVADECGLTVRLIGTPYEEGGGGKIYQMQDGAFAGAHAAIMMHPVSDGLDCRPAGTSCQAVGRWRATFTGQASHAAAAPHRGINAADAVAIAQVAIALLRQQTPDDHRMNMVIEHAGDVTNIIPGRAVVRYEARAWTVAEFETLAEKIHNCFRAGALATGCEVEIVPTDPPYLPLLQDEILSEHWCAAFGSFGRNVEPGPGMSGGSTDFGNVSQWMPGLHPWISLPGVDAPIHSEKFAAAANTETAYEAMFTAGVSMAWTMIGVAETPEHVAELRRRLAERETLEATDLPGQEDIIRRD